MASKTTRKKFRPPLKAPHVSGGGSLPCSQASGSTTCTGVAEGSQGKEPSRKESSQSWLSQLSAAEYSGLGTANLPANEASTGPATTCSSTELGLQKLDDSLCSDISHEKNSGGVPEGYGSESVQQSPAGSLQGTQTHTVLSYCSEANAEGCEPQKKSEVVAQQDRFQVLDFPGNTDSTAEYTTNNGSTDGSVSSLTPSTKFLLAGGSSSKFKSDGLDTPYPVEEEMDGETMNKEPSRFQRKDKPVARRYNYGNMLPKIGPQRVANKRTKKHRVSLIVNQSCSSVASNIYCFGEAEESTTSKGDLSVYDYQPTPQQEENGLDGHMEGEDLSELNNSRISKRTREEQLEVDREVLKTIAKVREEIRILRETYAAKKAQKSNLSVSSTFRVPQQVSRRSRIAVKRPLIMRQGYGSIEQKELHGAHHQQYTYLVEKEE